MTSDRDVHPGWPPRRLMGCVAAVLLVFLARALWWGGGQLVLHWRFLRAMSVCKELRVGDSEEDVLRRLERFEPVVGRTTAGQRIVSVPVPPWVSDGPGILIDRDGRAAQTFCGKGHAPP